MERRFEFPVVKKVELRNFSLYARQDIITTKLIDGVFCLVGANGLGKSTFLSTLNYALTGIVSDPKRKFESVDEFFNDSKKFADEYFNGRITENDRDIAEIVVEIELRDMLIVLTRGIFETEELRQLLVTNFDKTSTIIDTHNLTSAEKNSEYKRLISEGTGLNNFEQYVFMQHYVFTFDESRHLLFWDQKVLEQALYIAFSVNDDHAKKAEFFRRESEKADSRGRNFRWQATEVQKKARDIENALNIQAPSIPDLDYLISKHKDLVETMEELEEDLISLENQIRDANLLLSENSATEAVLRNKYNDVFHRFTNDFSTLSSHPLIIQSINDCRCGLCGGTGPNVITNIKKSIEGRCPLCQSELTENSTEQHLEELKNIDTELIKLKDKIQEILLTKERLNAELANKKNEKYVLENELEEFEQSNSNFLVYIKNTARDTESLESILMPYKIQIDQLLKRRDEEYKKRNDYREQLKILQHELEKQYVEAEVHFVPLFKDLAYSFIGIDLDIVMETKNKPGVSLLLEVKNITRREQFTLSESQRFFIDIALRMALAQYITLGSGKACLFIDTPEGSLDIAYESRAGNMLSRFVKSNYKIVMTANINSSKLLIRLAEECGKNKMHLCRMTSWNEMSEVQMSEETLFEEAYSIIELAMEKKGISHE